MCFSVHCFVLFVCQIRNLAPGSLGVLHPSLWWIQITICMATSALSEPAPISEDRVALARHRVAPILVHRFAQIGLSYPANFLFFRVHKLEREFEVWARNDNQESYRLVKTYPILGVSGGLGPKRRKGDHQVPEGFYQVDRFNPRSQFHLSLRIDYPNAADQKKSDPVSPGSEIYVHGGQRSAGCLAMGDDAIEEIYIMSQDASPPLPISIFPGRMLDSTWINKELSHPNEIAFWNTLKAGYRFFSERHELPAINVDAEGNYICP
jgi:murein L,D-transpeptidase YafK